MLDAATAPSNVAEKDGGQACLVPDRYPAIHNVPATETLQRISNVSGIHLTISFFTEVLENKTPERIIVKWEFHLTISFSTEVLESKAPEEKIVKWNCLLKNLNDYIFHSFRIDSHLTIFSFGALLANTSAKKDIVKWNSHLTIILYGALFPNTSIKKDIVKWN